MPAVTDTSVKRPARRCAAARSDPSRDEQDIGVVIVVVVGERRSVCIRSRDTALRSPSAKWPAPSLTNSCTGSPRRVTSEVEVVVAVDVGPRGAVGELTALRRRHGRRQPGCGGDVLELGHDDGRRRRRRTRARRRRHRLVLDGRDRRNARSGEPLRRRHGDVLGRPRPVGDEERRSSRTPPCSPSGDVSVNVIATAHASTPSLRDRTVDSRTRSPSGPALCRRGTELDADRRRPCASGRDALQPPAASRH